MHNLKFYVVILSGDVDNFHKSIRDLNLTRFFKKKFSPYLTL